MITTSPSDNSIKLFDTANFDLVEFIKVKNFKPGYAIEFINKKNSISSLVAVSDLESGKIYIYKMG